MQSEVSMQVDERVPLVNAKSVTSVGVMCAAGAAFAIFGGSGPIAQSGAVVVGLLAAYLVATMCLCRLRISSGQIEVGMFPFRKRLPIRDVVGSAARVVDPVRGPRLRWRKNGIGLPGMQLGWFTTSSGKPVFAATAGLKGRVLIPTRGAHDILVSCLDPDRVVNAVQRLCGENDQAGV